MTTLSIKSKGKTEIKIIKSLDNLRKACQDLAKQLKLGKAEIIGVSYDDEDEKTILINSRIINFHREGEK